MIELIRRNGGQWAPVATDEERATMVEQLAAREVDEERFAVWVAAQMA
jgi:hypothetical protein